MAQTAATAQSTMQSEYRAIEAALLETPRGRWFLAEHGRRARRVDSAALETAIDSLKSSLRAPPAVLSQLRNEVQELRALVETARTELFQRSQTSSAAAGAASHASAEATAHTSEAAVDGGGLGPSGILRAAEDMHQLAWSLHSNAIDADATAAIARHAAHIYAMSVAHAVESERVRRLSARLESAVLHLDGLLETLHHETQLAGDELTPPPALIAALPGQAPAPFRPAMPASTMASSTGPAYAAPIAPNPTTPVPTAPIPTTPVQTAPAPTAPGHTAPADTAAPTATVALDTALDAGRLFPWQTPRADGE